MGKNAIALSYKAHFTELDYDQSSLQGKESTTSTSSKQDLCREVEENQKSFRSYALFEISPF